MSIIELKSLILNPVKFPLSTQKEYVLIDVEGYDINRRYYRHIPIDTTSIQRLKSPFKFDAINRDKLGLIGGKYIMCRSNSRFFREVSQDDTSTTKEKNIMKNKNIEHLRELLNEPFEYVPLGPQTYPPIWELQDAYEEQELYCAKVSSYEVLKTHADFALAYCSANIYRMEESKLIQMAKHLYNTSPFNHDDCDDWDSAKDERKLEYLWMVEQIINKSL